MSEPRSKPGRKIGKPIRIVNLGYPYSMELDEHGQWRFYQMMHYERCGLIKRRVPGITNSLANAIGGNLR